MAVLPLPLGVEHPGLLETAESPRPPGKQKCVWGSQYGRLRPLNTQGRGPSPRPPMSPQRAQRGRPRVGGAWMGALTSHPSPSGRSRFREHPARSSAAGGGGREAARSNAAARGGARMGAWPPPPRSPTRQQGPLRSRARAGPEREAARGGES